MLMELKDSMFFKMNESFSLGDDGILKYKDRLCVLDVDDLKTKIIAETHGSTPNIQVPPRCIMILNRSISGMA